MSRDQQYRYEEAPDGSFRNGYQITETLFEGQSDFQKVTVVDTVAYGRMLLLDDLVQTTERDEFIYHEMIAHIPLLSLERPPERVLVIGGGDGGTAREVLKHPSVQEVVVCEIDGLVIDVCKQFLPSMAHVFDSPKVTTLVRDGIEYIATQKNAFDAILIDSSDPVGPGEGLFTEAFYQNVKAALKPGGIMVNQSESPMAQRRSFQLVYRLLNQVFPIVKPYIATIPTYPGGYWSWAYCSESIQPNGATQQLLAQSIEKHTQYFNQGIREASFVLPNFIQSLVSEATQEVSPGSLSLC
ncbi:MAG: polyamine aminopropyltransferase [Cyanobacteria bacterium]|nr:polyamine aminopropyltransferase [Cyanobacteriota bacterium]